MSGSCAACGADGPFHKDKSRADGRDHYCKSCRRKQRCVWYRERGGKQSMDEWYRKNKERKRAYQRARYTGWAPDRFNDAWNKQAGRCAICSVQLIQEGSKKNSAHADHDHLLNKPRGILCSMCNKALGQLGDSSDIVQKALEYLVYWEKENS